ncbi:MAG: hypothetical protein Sv326_0874 [Candidatus Fermentimicrarchaeum limneticum]|uniref:Uncharacterized protein n=1 Tax=Fermentimicrarchaeum limneticum TaxID=2795018 RepID=A0A7D5XK09_FERL1|nr:MAG: hypothetical protein Sv326_0874 [Candidatus Fermentimicrarchaeum limneticum]
MNNKIVEYAKVMLASSMLAIIGVVLGIVYLWILTAFTFKLTCFRIIFSGIFPTVALVY